MLHTIASAKWMTNWLRTRPNSTPYDNDFEQFQSNESSSVGAVLDKCGVSRKHFKETFKRQQKENNLMFFMCYCDMMNCSPECCHTRAQNVSVFENESSNYTGLEILSPPVRQY